MKKQQPKVFCAHRSVDKPKVKEVASLLAAAGVAPSVDDWEIRTGDDIAKRIDQGLAACDAGLIFFSSAVHSLHVSPNVSARIHQLIQAGRSLIPVMIDASAPVPPQLKPYAYLGVEQIESLIDAVFRRTSKPSLATPRPPVRDRSFRITLRSLEGRKIAVRAEVDGLPAGPERKVRLGTGFHFSYESFLEGRPAAGRKGLQREVASAKADLDRLGDEIGAAVFAEPIASAFTTLLGEARARGEGVLLIFESTEPTLLSIPFEAARLPGGLLPALQPGVRVLRRSPSARPSSFAPLPGPLRILATITPGGALDSRREIESIVDAMGGAQRFGQAEFRVLEVGHASDLQKALEAGSFHILHHLGHGAFSGVERETHDSASLPLAPKQVADAIRAAARPPSLVILNAARSGARHGDNVRLAQNLLRAGVPQVIAMHPSLSDSHATRLAGAFYHRLAEMDTPLVSQALALAHEDIKSESRAEFGPSAAPPEHAAPWLFTAAEERPILDRRLPAGPPAQALEYSRDGGSDLSGPAGVKGDKGLTETTRSLPPALAASDSDDPPRSAYGLLRCPQAAVVAREFELEIGLAKEPPASVAGPRLRRPATSVGPYSLAIQVVAEGFELREGESWRNDLKVTKPKPYPTFVLHLTPAPFEDDRRQREIKATFTVDGQPIGFAVRYVTVVKTPELLDAELGPAASPASGINMSIFTSPVPPDLVIFICREGDSTRLAWTFESRFDFPRPDEPHATDVGDAPEKFARGLMAKVNTREGRQGLYRLLLGQGRGIADKMPGVFWRILRDVASRVQGPPTVLILSQEPYIPWELAVLELPLDSAAPPFFAAQANVGRWVLPASDPDREPSEQRPPLPPPAEARVTALAVVSGVYKLPSWKPLREAEAEAETLHDDYGAVKVDASSTAVLDCLDGTPAADLLHFAMHGKYDPNGVEDGLMLTDGVTLDPSQVKAVDLPQRPFVFLNACQVGQGNSILGDYAGMASAFLYAGACGVVAPLWSIKDDVARGLALDFYKETLTQGQLPSDVLRRARAKFLQTNDAQSATWLAYQFFGHPALKLTRLPTSSSAPTSAATGGK